MEGAGGIDLSARLAEIAGAARADGAARAAESAAGGRAGEAAERFEALLATMLVKELRKALPEGFFGGGAGSDVFEGWLDEHLGGALARSGALHLEDAIRASLESKARAPAEANGHDGDAPEGSEA